MTAPFREQAAHAAGTTAAYPACEREWRFVVSNVGSLQVGQYPRYSGLPLPTMTEGWEGRRDGDAMWCLARSYRFFLVKLRYATIDVHGWLHVTSYFGLCAPRACNTAEVVATLVPLYVVAVFDALWLPGHLHSAEAWEWPELLHVVQGPGLLGEIGKGSSLHEHMFIFRIAILFYLGAIGVAMLVATANDEISSEKIANSSHSLLVEAFSLRRLDEHLLPGCWW